MAWAVTAEIYPSRYRSIAIGFCAASNWSWNFYLGFASPFIISEIGFAYGYVFAGCNLIAVLVVFFFLPETSGKSLEEIDTMFLMRIKPWKSSKWNVPDGETLASNDRRASEAYASRRASRASRGFGSRQNSSAQIAPPPTAEKDIAGGTGVGSRHVN
jgi:MFS transporter, SP family, sugar:H+ symporter